MSHGSAFESETLPVVPEPASPGAAGEPGSSSGAAGRSAPPASSRLFRLPPLPVETGLSILVLVESLVPGRPALTYVPFFPADTESPGRPSVAETPR